MRNANQTKRRLGGRRSILKQLSGMAVVATACSAAAVMAQQRHYEMVIPIAAGGSMDQMSRAIAEGLSTALGEPVVAVNKPGAGTVIGLRDVANETSTDGRKFVISGIGYTTLQFKQDGPPFDKTKLKPVMYIGWQPTVLFTRTGIPADTVEELVAWAKKNHTSVNFASSGIGSSPHIAAEQFAAMTGVSITNVPMAGSSAFVPALAGGHVDAVFDAPATRSMVEAGRLKALMVGLDAPLPDWPELPTSTSTGLNGLRAGTWYGVFVPATTPDNVVADLNQAFNKALATDVVKEKSQAFGIVLAGGSPDDFVKFLDSEQQRIGTLVKERGIVIP